MRHFSRLVLLAATFLPLLPAQRSGSFYTLHLEAPPLAELYSHGKPRNAAEFSAKQTQLRAAQSQLRRALEATEIEVLSSNEVLLNALHVRATPEQAAALEKVPGVAYVEKLRPVQAFANRALDVNNVRAAWNSLGGPANAGAGVRIAILDSGIDQNHPAFRDFPAAPPAGYPRCNASNGDCNFTNNKVIAARSYVTLLNFFFSTNPADTRPDDFSPRDRWGHGTAAAFMAAGQEHDSPIGRISGAAPGAFLGNYKVFGTEDVNSSTFAPVVLRALEDALADGMQIATLNLGGPAGFGPNDLCGANRNQPCDGFAAGVRAAVRAGMIVVASAGNFGLNGPNAPALNTVASPGTTPEAITVGAITNSHVWFNTLAVIAPNAPPNLLAVNVRLSDGPQPSAPFEAPAIDVARVGRDNLACDALPDNSLANRIAIVARGSCNISTKVNHAQRAGAIAVLVVNNGNTVLRLEGLNGTSIPSVLMGRENGDAIRNYLANNPDAPVRINPALREVNAPPDEIAFFSSQGPAIGSFGMKPDLVAVGTDLYMAAQRTDATGSLYSATGYLVADGTSFSSPLVAGAAALLRQRNPNLNPAQIKSLLLSTADRSLVDFDNNGRSGPAAITAMGAGKLNAARSLNPVLTFEPAAAEFGNLTGLVNFPSGGIVLRNNGSAVANVSTRIESTGPNSSARVTVAPPNFAVPPGGQTQITVALSGARPSPGRYEGFIVFTAGGVEQRVPYSYFIGDGVPWNIYSLTGRFDAIPGYRQNGVLVKIVDQHGVPVRDVPVTASVRNGTGNVQFFNTRTDGLGIVEASITVGASIGEQIFRFEAGNLFTDITANIFPRPALSTTGIRDAASGEASEAFSAGQYISLFGTGLAPSLRVFSGNELAFALARASVSFDNEAQRVSAAGRLHFVSPTQINVQIPWECEGLATVALKVSIGEFSSEVFTIRLRPANPSFFEYTEPVTNRRFIAALDAQFRLISSDNPVSRGQVAQLYANALGRVTNTPGSGQPSPSENLARTVETPEVTVGGRPAQVLFSGLAPGIVGLYQVNIIIPNDAPAGTDVEVLLRQSGASAKAARIAVR